MNKKVCIYLSCFLSSIMSLKALSSKLSLSCSHNELRTLESQVKIDYHSGKPLSLFDIESFTLEAILSDDLKFPEFNPSISPFKKPDTGFLCSTYPHPLTHWYLPVCTTDWLSYAEANDLYWAVRQVQHIFCVFYKGQAKLSIADFQHKVTCTVKSCKDTLVGVVLFSYLLLSDHSFCS